MAWQPVSEWFSQTSRRNRNKVAIEWGDRFMMYGELEDFSDRIANVLLSSGNWNRESVAAILSESPFQLAASILGTLKARGIFAPMDMMAPANRITLMLEGVSPDCILTGLAHAQQNKLIPDLACKPAVMRLADLEARGAKAQEGYSPFATQADPDAMCYLYFTSGSTGKPKAIAGRLKAIDHFVRWEIDTLKVDESSRFSQLASSAFDAYLKDVFVPLCAGGTVCAPDDRGIVWQPELFADWIDQARLTHLQCVPSIFRSLLRGPLRSDRFSDLQYVVLAGEPLLPSDVERWMTIFGERIRLVNLYGPSETTLIKLFHMVTAADRGARTVPIGKAMEGAAVLVLDERMMPCEPGLMGEIWIRTPFRTHGYYKQKELTDEVFIVNPFTQDPDDIIYRTRDYGRLREGGELEFAGRTDGQVKIRGARIELGEVEDVLRRCPAVADGAVVVRESGEEKSLCACVALHPGEAQESVTSHLAAWLPSYMTPTEVVVLESLPKTVTGKIDRKVLVNLCRRAQTQSNDEQPLTPLQQEIAEIWAAVLKKPAVRRRDDFFFLGGHSLSIIQVISRVRKKLDVEMAVTDMFVAPTLDAFAARVEQALNAKETSEMAAPAN